MILIICAIIGLCIISTYIVCVDNNYSEGKAFLCAIFFWIFWPVFLIYFGCITKDLWR